MLVQTLVCILYMQLAVGQDYTYVSTPSGRIRGQLRTKQFSDVYSAQNSEFLGIPYAKPPVGDLRFRLPELPDPWEEALEADQFPPPCPQYSEYPFPWYDSEPGHSEDCLYLNVWAPTNVSRASPVKFYIHGEDRLTQGSSRMGYYRGQDQALDIIEDSVNMRENNPGYLGIVVVTFNYRLGALGFFTSDTDDAPGNVGLYDILMAMEWVKSNIAAFGGDPDKISLVGQGSGAVVASLMCFSPKSVELFTNLILTGGSFLSIKGDSHEDNLRLGQRLAEAVGCDSLLRDDPGGTVKCLRGVNATHLVQVLGSFDQSDAFLPQYEHDDMLPLDPRFLLKDGYFRNRNIIFGYTADEGSYLLTSSRPKEFGMFGEKDVGVNATFAKSILKGFLKNYPKEVTDELVADFDEDATQKNRRKLYKIMGDERVVCPIVYMAEKFSDHGGTVYMFERKLHPPYNPWAEWMGTVHFSNVQFDFFSLDGPLTVNGQSYYVTEKQRSLAFFISVEQTRFLYTGKSFSVKFTGKDRQYSYENQDAKNFKKEDRTDPGGRNCEVFRPYFLSE